MIMKKNVIVTILLLITIFSIFFLRNMNEKDSLTENIIKNFNTHGCLALNYHRVLESKISTKILESLTKSDELRKYSIYEEDFEYQMKTLVENNVYFATIDDVLKFQEEGSFPNKCIWISFDDVEESVYHQAFPILKKYDIPFTLFAIASQVGNENFNNHTMATWDQIQEMVDSGLATVGSHSYDMHYLEEDEPIFLYEENYGKFEEDLLKSKKTIEANLQGVEVLDFAYPFGNGREELAQIIRENGFRTASILAPYSIDSKNNHYWLNRILVDSDSFENSVLPWISRDENQISEN